MMLCLQSQGCHNINVVTPEHVAPQVLEAVSEAVPLGLRLPIVYNTSAYDSLESIASLDGIVDIYMPDFKYWSSERSKTYMKAANYPDAARASIQAMHAQVGPLVVRRHPADGADVTPGRAGPGLDRCGGHVRTSLVVAVPCRPVVPAGQRPRSAAPGRLPGWPGNGFPGHPGRQCRRWVP